jgi:hypothetical protein
MRDNQSGFEFIVKNKSYEAKRIGKKIVRKPPSKVPRPNPPTGQGNKKGGTAKIKKDNK